MTLDTQANPSYLATITGSILDFGSTPCACRASDGLEISKFKHGGPRENSGGYRPGAGRKPRIVHLNPEPQDTLRWYCIRTDYGFESKADREIRYWLMGADISGWELFNPSVWRPATKPRRDSNGVVRPGRPARVVQMFPRYMLMRFLVSNPRWREIVHLEGVERIMSTTPMRPIPVPDEAIEFIRNFSDPKFGEMAPNGCVYPPKQAPKGKRIANGTQVRIKDGLFASWTGMVSWSDQRRVEVMLQMLGGERPFEMDSAMVEVVG